MCRSVEYSLWLVALLIVALVGCAPAATSPSPAPSPSVVTKEVVQLVVVTPTLQPTVKPKFKSVPLPKPVVAGKFDVGGRKLYIECFGAGSPTVILEHGRGMSVYTWHRIIPSLAAQTRVCAYDRMNSGKSEATTEPRTMDQAADELHTLLSAAQIEGPYVLAGHSLGGLFALVYADRYTDDIAGIALVDSTHPDQVAPLLAALPTPSPNETEALKSLRDALSRPSTQPEGIDWEGMMERVRAIQSVGDIPLVVLVAVDPGKLGWGDIPSELATRLHTIRLDLQKKYATLSTESSLILAEHSSHFIQDDEPQLVIDAILGLVDKARQK